MAAAVSLVRKVKGVVTGAACIIELTFLKGRQRLDVPVHSVLAYDS
jgi:adenine phosphoribosyltransferase